MSDRSQMADSSIQSNTFKNNMPVLSKAITHLMGRLGLFLIIVVFSVILSFLSPAFLGWTNLTNVLLQSTILGTLAIGETFVLIAGGLDLSIGGVLAVSSAVGLGLMDTNHVPTIVGILVSLLIGLIFGAINGLSVTKLRISALIVTLATMGAAQGLVLIYTNGATISPVPDIYNYLGVGRILGIPVIVIIVLVFSILASLILNKTVFGRKIYATGGNEIASSLSGIRTHRVIFSSYLLSGLMASIAGILLTSRLESVGPTAGDGMELTVIAAVVIGGTSLFGGQGNISGTILGVILLSLVSNAIDLLGVPAAWIQLVQGSVIFLAALLDVYRRKISQNMT